MRRAFLGAFLALIAISGCGNCRHVSSSNTKTSETIKVIRHSELVPVLVKVEIPEISERVFVRDSSSRLENRFAVSEARIHRDGTLEHSLMTKGQELEKETQVRTEYKDSIVFRDREVEKTIEVPVEKSLTWWQRFRIWAFWPLLVILAFAYRKEIKGLIKLLV